MKGRRVPWPEDLLPIEIEAQLQPGDYAGPWHGKWMLCAPNGDLAMTGTHTITVHEDDTLTLSPSVQFETGQRWHGYLERGVWRT